MRCCVVIIRNMYIITTTSSNNIHITYDDNTAAHQATCGLTHYKLAMFSFFILTLSS